MYKKNIPFEVKIFDDGSESEHFTFEGLASVFNSVDLGNDTILKGAFTESLAEFTPKLVWQHRMDMPIGRIESIFESDKGLRIKGLLPKADTFVSGRIIPQMRIGSVDSMSIGFSIKESDTSGDIRVIKKIQLFEISLVTLPMEPKAKVESFKAVVPFQDLPLAAKDTPWDATAAIERVRSFTDSKDEPSQSYRRAFSFFDEEKPESFASYKLLIADIIDGTMVAVPKAIFAADALLNGTSDNTKIDNIDKIEISTNIERYRKKIEDADGSQEQRAIINIDNLDALKTAKTKKDFEVALRDTGHFSRKASVFIASLMKEKSSDLTTAKTLGDPEHSNNPRDAEYVNSIKQLNEFIKGL